MATIDKKSNSERPLKVIPSAQPAADNISMTAAQYTLIHRPEASYLPHVCSCASGIANKSFDVI